MSKNPLIAYAEPAQSALISQSRVLKKAFFVSRKSSTIAFMEEANLWKILSSGDEFRKAVLGRLERGSPWDADLLILFAQTQEFQKFKNDPKARLFAGRPLYLNDEWLELLIAYWCCQALAKYFEEKPLDKAGRKIAGLLICFVVYAKPILQGEPGHESRSSGMFDK